MEGDTCGLIMMAEAGAEVEAGATESGASEPPQAALRSRLRRRWRPINMKTRLM
jgi:hypothetical protein